VSNIEKEIICISFIERKIIMTFKTFPIFLIVMVFSIPSLCFSAQPDSKVWESFDNDWYYNKTNIDKSSYIISVWVYKSVTNDSRKEKIEIIKKSDLDKSIKYQKFDHYLSLWEIDTKNKQKRLKELKDYDDKGNVLESNVYKDREWKDIKPNSIFDKLYIKLGLTQNEQPAKEQPAKEQQVKEQQVKEQQAKEQQAKEQQAKEQQAKEQQAKEQQAKEQQVKEQQAKEQQVKEQQAKEQQAKEQQVKEQQANEQRAKEQQVKETPAQETTERETTVRESSAISGKPMGKSWEFLSDNVYYNKRNFTKLSNIVSVWTYNIVTDDFREQKIEAIKKNDLDKSRKYEYYDHNVVLSEINCRKRLARTKMYVDYDDAGEVLTSYTYNNREWNDIITGSPCDKLYQKLCMTRKASLHKKKSKIHSSRQKVEDEGSEN
jgi:chemotaxis protein histidine kinase CheA